MLKVVPKDKAYAAIQGVAARGLLLLDWGETPLALLASIDESRAWPEIVSGIRSGEANGFRARELAQVLSSEHQAEFLNLWTESTKDAWYFGYLLKAIQNAQIPLDAKLPLLSKLKEKVVAYRGSFKYQADLITAINEALSEERAEADSAWLDALAGGNDKI
jgi:hypothetical protein